MSKKFRSSKLQDPYAERESLKYVNPIASRELILEIISEFGSPISLNQLSDKLDINTKLHKRALRFRLKAMVRDSQLIMTKKRHFWLCRDSVKNKIITGRFVKEKGLNYVVIYGNHYIKQDIIIPKGLEKSAKNNDSVVVDLTPSFSKCSQPVGKIVEVLGISSKRDVIINSAMRSFSIESDWQKDVKDEIKNLVKIKNEDNYEDNNEGNNLKIKANKNFIDLRSLPFVTIDGGDAKDFDDAVFCKPNCRSGWKLYVAIANVSHYVKPNSPLDKIAKQKGNSVYFPTKTVPMLPEILSTDLCSLKPNVDRLCLVCEMNISKSGKLTKYVFYESVIHSKSRLTYDKVASFLEQEEKGGSYNFSKDVANNLKNLFNVYLLLQKLRDQRGAIDFDTVESKIIFKNNKIKEIVPTYRNVAHKIIEECMLSANVSAAKLLQKHKIPTIYRIHGGPTQEKICDLNLFLASFGLTLCNTEVPLAEDYSKLLKQIKNRKDANIVRMVLLRSLSQAIYSPENIGHFGLAYSAYTHFTSPIRRYSDLIIHRLIKKIINDEDKKEIKNKELVDNEVIKEISNNCSLMERKADEAVRDVIKVYKCQYIEQYLGQTFTGIISGVTNFGFFVELEDIYLDGLVSINSLIYDYFIFDHIHHQLTGEMTGKVYKLGMKVKVILSRVNVDKRRIDFDLAESIGLDRKKKRIGNKGKRSRKRSNKT